MKRRIKKKRYPWGGIFNKKRFEWMEKEKREWLQNLTLEESIKMTEEFLSSRMFEQFRDNFFQDTPLCFKLGLKMRKKNVRK